MLYMEKAINLLKKKCSLNTWEAADDGIDFVEDGKNFFCYFQCFYWLYVLHISPQCFFSILWNRKFESLFLTLLTFSRAR